MILIQKVDRFTILVAQGGINSQNYQLYFLYVQRNVI